MFELFSKRRARREGKYPPPPRSREFSPRLRHALFYALRDTFGEYDQSFSYISAPFEGNAIWESFHSTLFTSSDEYHAFPRRASWNSIENVFQFFSAASDAGIVDALDYGVFLVVHAAPRLHRSYTAYDLRQCGVSSAPSQTLAQLDHMLRSEGTIYRIADNELIISADDYTHNEAIVPALQALAEPGFDNALQEFHTALKDLRQGDYADALTKANHAFESTMKVIATKMGWPFNETDTSSKLIGVMVQRGLFPPMRESALSGLRVLLESDVPTLRNRTPSAGHGAGTNSTVTPEPIASYAVVAAAANIKLLMELYKARIR